MALGFTYLQWLVLISLFFFLLEWVIPWHRNQHPLRSGLLRDLVFLYLNGYGLWFLFQGFFAFCFSKTIGLFQSLGLSLEQNLVGDWPFWGQLLLFAVCADFIQWCTHVTLHRVPWLWNFHKVHHSIPHLDWAANFHFHWFEILVYRTTQAVPLTLLGAPESVTIWVFLFGTFWGHFNHANIPLRIGPLKYIFNSPRMHLWHHDASAEGGVSKNYGIVLSCWDWLFGTVHWPEERDPERLGYPGDDAMPQGLLGQLLWPLTGRR